MAGEYNDWLIHKADQCISRMRQSDAIANAGAMQKFALAKRAEQGLAGLRLVRELGDLVDEFIERRVPVGAAQVQVHGRRRKEFAEARIHLLHAAILDRGARG